MVLAIDCGGLRQSRGISNYIENLIKCISNCQLDFDVILIVPKGCKVSLMSNSFKII